MKVVYILGTSYSGSTLLGALLGMQADSFCAGELGSWTLRKGSEHLACSCGILRKDCLFWKQVKKNWLLDEMITWEEIRKLQSPIERFLMVSRIHLARAPAPHVLEQYARLVRKQFHVISELSGKQIIIDNSKRVGRAGALARVKDLDIAYIHLIREGRGFLASSLKRYKQHRLEKHSKERPLIFLMRSTLEWILINRTAERITTSSGKPYLRIRYEDFITHPSGSLERIGDLLGVGMDGILEQVLSGTPLPRGHMGGGNLSHLAGSVTFRLDETWKLDLPASWQSLFWALAGTTERRYGYSRK